jgi:hypothetical protein
MHTLLSKRPELQNNILQQQQQQQGSPSDGLLYKWNKKLKAVCSMLLKNPNYKNKTSSSDFFFYCFFFASNVCP